MRRVLLITYYFPPCGGASVQRWVRFIRHLPKLGWETTVITASEEDYHFLDSSLARKIPSHIKILRTKRPLISKLFALVKAKNKGNYPYGTLISKKDDPFLKKAFYWARINLIIPDSRLPWNNEAYKLAKEELRSRKYSLIITTGPPHSTHLVGLKLKEATPIPWIADFRDPWTDIYYLQSVKQNPILKALNKRLEKEVIAKADTNIIVSKSIADALPAGNKYVLSNGYDSDDFADVTTKKTTFFRLKYVGQLTEGQDIFKPLKWLNEFCGQDEKKSIEFSLVGTTLADFEGIKNQASCLHLRITPPLPHREAIEEMVNSEILLLLINNCPNNKGILTTKLFEYIASRTYIIAIGPTDSEVANYLDEYKAGVIFDYDDKMGFISTVKQKYELWQEGLLAKNDHDISPLSAEEQAKELSKIFESVTKGTS